MVASVIDGKAFAAGMRNSIAGDVSRLKEQHGITPGLAVVLVGQDPASEIYVRNKARMTREVGMVSFRHHLPQHTTQKELLQLIENINNDPLMHGLLVQLPLPAHIDEESIITAIRPDKDVDGFHPSNVGRLAMGKSAMVPCTPLGCLMLLKDELGSLAGKNALVLGRSNIVGKPMANLLLREHCTVTVAHSRTRDLIEHCNRVDILVSAVGRPSMIKGNWVRPGSVVIDVGISRIHNSKTGKGRIVGDVDYSEVSQVAGAITPVPGGVGPMTIACLLANTYRASCQIHGLKGETGTTQEL